jgi:hypothetical protein
MPRASIPAAPLSPAWLPYKRENGKDAGFGQFAATFGSAAETSPSHPPALATQRVTVNQTKPSQAKPSQIKRKWL